MNDVLNPVQAISYTNKDFQTIFPELLNLVKQLTSRWDPSMSNESDPGVVLLKLNAILADKLNYNLDKNVLECFPISVTQESNARHLFDTLGYKMKWYQSAVTNVSIKYTGTAKSGYVTIPPFTMVSDANNTAVYTLIGSTANTDDNTFSVGSQNLYYDNSIIAFKAIQGIAVNYDINGNLNIKAKDLDSKNRLYFSSYNVAQNGIFITNVGENNYSSWVQKDNLIVESLNNTYYSFGLSDDGSVCYLEFPNDAENIMKDGINITYIKTTGSVGNIGINTIEKFYTDVYLTDSNSESVILSDNNTMVTNYESSTVGLDPETISSAYRNYQRVSGTFETLVTLRDYINYILRSGLVSNCFVCDRTNDVQCVYTIMTEDNGINSPKVYQDEHVVNKDIKLTDGTIVNEDVLEPSLSAFDIKLYLFEKVQSITNVYDFGNTFNLLSPASQDTIKYYLEDKKCISHDYAELLPVTSENSHVCFFKNKYPIKCRIIPKYKLTDVQIADVQKNINKAIFEHLNCSALDFSEEVTLDSLNDIILNADNRIKSISLENIVYTTYAVLWDGVEFTEVKLSSDNDMTLSQKFTYAASEYDSLTGYITGSFCIYNGIRYRCTSNIDSPAGAFDISKWVKDELSMVDSYLTDESFILSLFGSIGNYSTSTFRYASSNGGRWTNTEDVSIYFSNSGHVNGTPQVNDLLQLNVSNATHIQDELFTKSVLAGITPLYSQDGIFDYTFNQQYTNLYEDIDSISSNVDITLTKSASEYTLRNNETIQLYAPNFINGSTYSNYVKYECQLNNELKAGEDYELSSNEYIIFYWKAEDDALSIYEYYVYAQGNIIKPSFSIPVNTTAPIGASLAASDKLTNIGSTLHPVLVASTTLNGPMDSLISDQISSLVNRYNVLSGSKNIVIRKVNQIILDSSYYCYWVLNDAVNGQYVLFENDPSVNSQTKILNSGEYFFYSNASLTELGILGSGTTISRNSGVGNWAVSSSINLEDIFEYGTTALRYSWVHPIQGQETVITENQYINLSAGSTIKLTRIDGANTWSVTFNSNGTDSPLSDYTIKYKNATGDDWIDVDQITVSNSYSVGWNGRSLLNIDISKSVQQRLLSDQSITLYSQTGAQTTINGANVATDSVTNRQYYPVVIESSLQALHDGGGKHTVSQVVSSTNTVYDSIFVYRENLSSSDGSIRINTHGDTILTFDSNVTTLSLKYRMPQGNYMFRVINSSTEISTLTITDSVYGAIGAVYDDAITDFASIKNCIAKLTIADDLEHTITVNISEHEVPVVISLIDPFKYSKPTWISDYRYDITQMLIKQFDKDHVFNYLYDPDENDRILNPLLPSSFLLDDHIANRFVICQADLLSSELQLVNKK